ncbi:MAG: DEAD/DEAH box helicase [Solirubrobacteraceae bacterium]
MAVDGATEQAPPAWERVLASGRDDGRLVAEDLSGRGAARLLAAPADLHPEVLRALANAGISELYSHQARAVSAAWERATIVTTGTASGKSLCFNLPTLDVLCRDPQARALYLYPTKALAQDQARALARFAMQRLRPSIYDGDTPRPARAEIRRRSNVVLTNPDMLHVGILPNHEAWADLFANLAIVVVDEAHVYRGVFGSHVGNVLRRLRRIANAYGTTPRFLLASATIANPLELAQRLTGIEDFELIDEDGAPTAARHTAIWNPPLTDERSGARASAAAEGAELLAGLVLAGARAICFVRSRKGVELVSKLLQDRLRASDPALAELVAPYRAGYTPQQRREIEGRLTSGRLRAVISTDALELGIDIGELDAAVVVTFPGTVASLRQMWGRAGRRGSGLAVYVAGEDALDQFFCRHPNEFLDRRVEAAILDHESVEIHLAHMLCAAYEGPLSASDAEFLGPRWESYAETLLGAGRLRRRDRPEEIEDDHDGDGDGRRRARIAPRSYVPRRPGAYPAADVSLRSASPDSFAIVDVQAGELLGSTEAARAHSTVHRGAIYMHLGRSYEVLDLDLDRRQALVRPFAGDWYTQPKTETDTAIERLLDRRDTLGVTLSFGEASVTETVIAYQRKRLADHAQIDLVALDLPRSTFATKAIWYELPDALLDPATDPELPLEALLGALHATEHSQIAVLPLIAMCDRWDIGGLSTNLHPQTGGPTIFIYDGHPGGIGISRTAFARFEELCDDAHRLIAGCGCESGCPSCVQSPKCGNLNEPLSKLGARLLLGRMLAPGQ